MKLTFLLQINRHFHRESPTIYLWHREKKKQRTNQRITHLNETLKTSFLLKPKLTLFMGVGLKFLFTQQPPRESAYFEGLRYICKVFNRIKVAKSPAQSLFFSYSESCLVRCQLQQQKTKLLILFLSSLSSFKACLFCLAQLRG